MKILDLIETDFVNYKKPCMTVMFPYCTFKCNIDARRVVCHNYAFRDADIVEMSVEEIVTRYLSNPISEAIVMQGLEPFDSFDELVSLVWEFTDRSNDDIVIYTGYNKDEIEQQLQVLVDTVQGNNLIIKFGRYIPDDGSIYDKVLGVTLNSANQRAEIIKEGDIDHA